MRRMEQRSGSFAYFVCIDLSWNEPAAAYNGTAPVWIWLNGCTISLVCLDEAHCLPTLSGSGTCTWRSTHAPDCTHAKHCVKNSDDGTNSWPRKRRKRSQRSRRNQQFRLPFGILGSRVWMPTFGSLRVCVGPTTVKSWNCFAPFACMQIVPRWGPYLTP